MEKYTLQNDISLFCVTAKAYPIGIVEAFQTLENIHPSIAKRPFYGLSFEDKNGNIIYKAAVKETYEGEGKKYGCETFIIPKGDYLTETIFHFMRSIDIIPETFRKLLASPWLDTTFPCVECYKSNEELLCMVKINLLERN